MNGEYERYLIRLLAPLGLYDLNGAQNRSELAALGAALDGVSALLDTVERESLLNTAEDLIDVTGIFAQDNALEHLGVQSGRTVTHFAVAADTLIGVDTDDVIDPMSVGTLIDFADLHIRNAQITGTGAGVLDVNVHDWSPPDYFICDVILACKFFFFNTHHSLYLLRND